MSNGSIMYKGIELFSYSNIIIEEYVLALNSDFLIFFEQVVHGICCMVSAVLHKCTIPSELVF